MKQTFTTPPRAGFGAQQAAANPRSMLEQLGISQREVRRYSLSRALLAVGTDAKLVGYEAEVDQALRRQLGVQPRSTGGMLIPTGIALTRDLTAGSASAGGYLVGTENIGASFIDLLRNKLVTVAMGATVMSGLRDNITIPKQTAAGTATWLANEASTITESQQTLGQVSMSPKNVGAYTEFSRQLLLQSNPSVDQMIANDLSKVVALAIDAAAINGSGASGQPTGIIGTAGIGSVTGTSLGLAGLIEFQTDVAGANAMLDAKAVGYVTTPTVAALLKQRQAFAGTNSPLWEGNLAGGNILGMNAMSSAQMPAGSMLFGDWSQLLIGEWGMLEIASNPYANFQGNVIGVRAIQTVDVAVRVPGAFSYASSIT